LRKVTRHRAQGEEFIKNLLRLFREILDKQPGIRVVIGLYLFKLSERFSSIGVTTVGDMMQAKAV
jgi:hypothetical protein